MRKKGVEGKIRKPEYSGKEKLYIKNIKLEPGGSGRLAWQK